MFPNIELGMTGGLRVTGLTTWCITIWLDWIDWTECEGVKERVEVLLESANQLPVWDAYITCHCYSTPLSLLSVFSLSLWPRNLFFCSFVLSCLSSSLPIHTPNPPPYTLC